MNAAELIAAEFTHAIFERIHPRAELAPVPLVEAAQFDRDAATRGEPVRLVKVARANGDWSWGKAWWDRDTGRMVRIGAGAYGDLTVWKA